MTSVGDRHAPEAEQVVSSGLANVSMLQRKVRVGRDGTFDGVFEDNP